jgi:hypothetical protein
VVVVVVEEEEDAVYQIGVIRLMSV